VLVRIVLSEAAIVGRLLRRPPMPLFRVIGRRSACPPTDDFSSASSPFPLDLSACLPPGFGVA
jgi:hypothetical protein